MKEDPQLLRRLDQFLKQRVGADFHPDALIPLTGDASTRRYFRLSPDHGPSLILTVYPEPFDPNRFDYQEVYLLFRKIRLPVPEILATDSRLGIVLQEDLGDETLEQRLLTAPDQEQKALVRKAIDHLLVIQKEGTAALNPDHVAARRAFDQKKLSFELDFFLNHYLDVYRRLEFGDRKSLATEFTQLSLELANLPRLLCHRDYQVRNLMLKGKTIYITDFQDARLGPASYDLVSLLKDSIDLDANEVAEHVNYYLGFVSPAAPQPEFLRQFHLVTIQRMLKALGTYGYQITRRRKDVYSRYVTGSLKRALYALETVSEFPTIRSLVKLDLAS